MEPSAGPSRPQTKRHVKHVSRACDRCRRRRIKCDGTQPTCGVCTERGHSCTFTEEDGRKTNREIDELKTRLAALESHLQVSSGSQNEARVVESAHSDESALSSTTNEEMDDEPPTPATSSLSGTRGHAKRKRIADRVEHPVVVERLKRSKDGPLLHFGPISIFNYDNRQPAQSVSPTVVQTQEQDGWVAWSRNLPLALNLDKAAHEEALEYFIAYYAPWCLVVDPPAFLRDLDSCNLVDRYGVPVAEHSRTPSYSPLMHCAALYLGLCLVRSGRLEGRPEYWEPFQDRCHDLFRAEGKEPSLSSVRAINLWSSCLNYEPETAYMYFGMTFAATLALGLNPDAYVKRGQMTSAERDMRNSTFWTIHLQDVLRAIAAGRAPMLPESPGMPLPAIDKKCDAEPWIPPKRVQSEFKCLNLDGLPSLRSTVFHWTAKLGLILRDVISALYSIQSDATRRASPPQGLVRRLDTWFKQVPIDKPLEQPLPHILMLHMLYHLLIIYLHRPYYRAALSTVPSSADRCSRAADEIVFLLNTYEATHGVQNAPMTLSKIAFHTGADMWAVQVVFGAATVFLLKSVGDEPNGLGAYSYLDKFDLCLDHLERHGKPRSSYSCSLYSSHLAPSHDRCRGPTPASLRLASRGLGGAFEH
ncbi:hypothetical protein BCR39DRAFT_242527 [Naematelia encephala]|uniref:Zn(2)-C6 fungal-type domain-containing protein n=1 Tax=Naematelia encephala TaxID=71784 RepID=A0A1Y2AX18_9TREE|nr:hypothetical protein BCR39DRAFT_242527 [Naematelia encephala]